MVSPLVECVPNFSEGRDITIIDAITSSIESVEGVTILDVDMGYDFNRTVVTMIGTPEPILEAAIVCTTIATKLIDMRNHVGEHARMGAVDVVPFIPISGVSMAECVELSQRYAQTVSDLLSLPVYLYGESAISEHRVRLPDIRKGEYEGLSEKIVTEEWEPDFGPAEFKPKMGATATGARNILIAYNVNLDTDDKSKANAIAAKIRTSGSLLKDKNGKKIIGIDGKPLRNPGKFKSLQAAGWMYDNTTAQVSMNLLDYNVTGLDDVTEAIRYESAELGLNAVAGELVGLVPLQAMLSAGRFYHENPQSADVMTLVKTAITGLMLDQLGEFDSESSIIESAIVGGGYNE
jgi:glutamate formiminotransferase/formiminotetrahydrofolate cyclodeaminase